MAVPTVSDIVNTTMMRMAGEYARKLTRAYPLFSGPPPRDIFRSVTITGLDEVEFPGYVSRVTRNMEWWIHRRKMLNLYVGKEQYFNRDAITVRIIIDSKGWTG